MIAVYNVGLKISMFIITCSFSFGNGLGSFAAQNLGAGKIDRVFEGFRAARRMIYIYIVPCVLVCIFGAKILVGLFLQETDAVAVETGVMFLWIYAWHLPISLRRSEAMRSGSHGRLDGAWEAFLRCIFIRRRGG